MFKYLRKAKKLVFSFGYFEASQYFRFRKQQAYVHNSAGITSLVLQIVIFISLIYNLVGVGTRSTVIVTESISYSNSPPLKQLSQANNFMIAIEQKTLKNLNGNLGIFFYQHDETAQTKTLIGSSQKCKIQHWRSIPNIQNDFNIRKINQWNCIPLDFNAKLEGSKSAETNKYISVQIQCKNCSIQNSAPLETTIHYINPIINPQDGKSYLTYTINSDNFLSIRSSTIYNSLSLFMSDYSISSDQSILPWFSMLLQQGVIFSDARTQFIQQVDKNSKAQINFRRGSKTLSYTRLPLKIMDAFYFMIGSFAPTLVAFFFFINPILSMIFEMRFATYVYKVTEVKKFGFFGVFLQKLYALIKKACGCCQLNQKTWNKYKKVEETRKILSRVMEVQYLYERIQFLERAIKVLFKDHQLCGLHLVQGDSLNEAFEKYKSYELRKLIKNYVISEHKKQWKSLKSIEIPKGKKNPKDSLSKINQLQGEIPDTNAKNFKQEEVLSHNEYDLDVNKEKKEKQRQNSIKQRYFDQIDSDFDSDSEYEKLEKNKEFYVEVVEKFNRLKEEAESGQSQNRKSKLIFDQLSKKDVNLMQQFRRRMNLQIKERLKSQSDLLHLKSLIPRKSRNHF